MLTNSIVMNPNKVRCNLSAKIKVRNMLAMHGDGMW